MPFRVRAWMVGGAVGAIILLVLLSLLAPPDGGERAELAQFLGRFHPLLVHFPIALIVLVPILESAGLLKEHFRSAAGFVLSLATAAAVVTASFGWLLAWSGGFEGPLVTRHMWGGITLTAVCLGCWSLRRRDQRLYSLALVVTTALMVWTSDQGGKLTHGSQFLTERMPMPFARWFGAKPHAKIDPASFYATRVQPIFGEKCVLCHNSEKFKGKLRLDSYENVMLGGKDGPVIRAGDPGHSELYRRITLPLDNKDFMPAEGKPALSEAETKVIEVWIAAGAAVQIPDSFLKALAPQADKRPISPPLAPDYRSQSLKIVALDSSLGVQLIPRSQNPTDGLILRTFSAPARCNDSTLENLAPVASLIVDAELARSQITDQGMRTIGTFSNLRFLDLSNTGVTSAGLNELVNLQHLESLNLTHTKVRSDELGELRKKTGLKIYVFESR